MDTEQLQSLLDQYNPNELVLELRKNMFKASDFDFIVKGIANNTESNWKKGEVAKHIKQEKALQILTSNEYDQFLYGGAAGGAKSFTGMCWVILSALCYPNTRYFIARNELKDIRDSVMVTFGEVCDFLGVKDFKYNAVFNYIKFPNGSEINLIEVKYKPSDPEYKDVGSTLYTSGWFEEVGEVNEKAVSVLTTRVNRWNVDKYGLKGIVFMTGNPSKNWTKQKFHDKAKKGLLEIDNEDESNFKKYYLGCLVTENPFISQKYIDSLRKQASNDKAIYERLFKGNWDYDDNPYQLANQEAIEEIFDNDHVTEGMSYLTVDVARFGADKAVLIAWKGWVVKEIITYDLSSTQKIVSAITYLRQKYRIPKSRCIADSDGVGGGVVDIADIKSFKNNGTPIGINRNTPNYANLQVQCLYLLADKINEREIYIEEESLSNLDDPKKAKEHILEELAQIQSRPNVRDATKLQAKNKSEIKEDIRRSPDYRDALFMRIWFDLKPQRRAMVSTAPRDYF